MSGSTHKRVHMAVDVHELLQRSDRELDGVLTINGEPASGSKARETLAQALSEGKQVIPYCAADACPDFDYTGGGCPGHPVENSERVAS